jgi:hypothetical protein
MPEAKRGRSLDERPVSSGFVLSGFGAFFFAGKGLTDVT